MAKKRVLCIEDHPEMISRNSRNGLILFTVYCIFYAGFVLISAFAPHIMSAPAVAGVNLAIIYGFSLIIGALVLVLLIAGSVSAQTGIQRAQVVKNVPAQTKQDTLFETLERLLLFDGITTESVCDSLALSPEIIRRQPAGSPPGCECWTYSPRSRIPVPSPDRYTAQSGPSPPRTGSLPGTPPLYAGRC